MINFFKTLNPLNILWLIILLFITRAGYIFNIPGKIEFAFPDLSLWLTCGHCTSEFSTTVQD